MNKFSNKRIPCGDNDRNSGESDRRSPKEPLLILLSPALCNANDEIMISNTSMFCFDFYFIITFINDSLRFSKLTSRVLFPTLLSCPVLPMNDALFPTWE